jgi:hypothetical protein
MLTLRAALHEVNGATFQSAGPRGTRCQFARKWGVATKNLRSRFGGSESQERGRGQAVEAEAELYYLTTHRRHLFQG